MVGKDRNSVDRPSTALQDPSLSELKLRADTTSTGRRVRLGKGAGPENEELRKSLDQKKK